MNRNLNPQRFHENEKSQKYNKKLSGTDRARAVSLGPEALLATMRETFGATSGEVYRAETLYADFCYHCWRELLRKHDQIITVGGAR